jgi:tetratricopeptide (TPR) repeat protein
VLALGFLCMRERLVERPHLFSLLGEVALASLLPSLAKGERRQWLGLPLVVAWVNFHAGAFLAAAMLAFAALGALLDRAPARTTIRLLVFAASALVLLMVSPVGAGIYRYLAFHVGIFDIHPVDEFRNLTWRSDWPFVLFALATLVLLMLSRRQPWLLKMPAVGFAALATWHVRFSADAIMMLALVAAPALEELAGGFTVLRSRLAMAAFLVLAATVALAPRIAAATHGARFLALDLDRGSLPLDALAYVEEHGLRDRMYNDFETGAYLLWQGYPRFRVFVDPRLPAYPAEFHRLLGRMDVSRTEWTAAMDGLGVESALLDYAGINRRVAYWDPEAWALVFRARDTRVFVRRLPKWRELIARFEIPATFDFTVEDGARTQALGQPPAASPVPDCEWQIRLGDLYFDLEGRKSSHAVDRYRSALAAPGGCLSPDHELEAASWLGSLDVAGGRFADALPLLDRALACAPDDTALLANRALALTAAGRVEEARETWKKISVLAPGTELGRRATEKASLPR